MTTKRAKTATKRESKPKMSKVPLFITVQEIRDGWPCLGRWAAFVEAFEWDGAYVDADVMVPLTEIAKHFVGDLDWCMARLQHLGVVSYRQWDACYAATWQGSDHSREARTKRALVWLKGKTRKVEL